MRKPSTRPALPREFWDSVNLDGPEGVHSQTGKPIGQCWLWTGPLDRYGYAKWMVMAYQWKSCHRMAYEAFVGRIPEGLHLDHLCRVRGCVRPDHGEPVTLLENLKRGRGFNSRNYVPVTHCRKGHLFTPETTIVSKRKADGKVQRQCKVCADATRRKRFVSKRKPVTHCPKGHEYTPENTKLEANPAWKGRGEGTMRHCRECMREADRKRASTPKRRAAAKAYREANKPSLQAYVREWKRAQRLRVEPDPATT